MYKQIYAHTHIHIHTCTCVCDCMRVIHPDIDPIPQGSLGTGGVGFPIRPNKDYEGLFWLFGGSLSPLSWLAVRFV